MTPPRFASAAVDGPSLGETLDRAADLAALELARRPDVAFLFVSTAYGPAAAEAGDRLRARTGARAVVGCTGAGVCGREGEFESEAAVSVLLAALPDATARTFTVRQDQLLTMEAPEDLRAVVGLDPGTRPGFVLFADPYTLDADLLLERLEAAYPGSVATGGLASGGTRPGAHALYADDHSPRYGAVGLAIAGWPLRGVVSQGCRPVGRRFVVTRCREGKVLGLSGRPALAAIRDVLMGLPVKERMLATKSLLLGRVTEEAREDFRRGDFLVRHLVGADPSEGAVVVADKVRVGHTVQLQLRDRASAEEDLEAALATAAEAARARAVLLFTCSGRGRRLFEDDHHDVRAVARHLGHVPLAGFFCGGEIGPVAGRNFLHGYTASLGLF